MKHFTIYKKEGANKNIYKMIKIFDERGEKL